MLISEWVGLTGLVGTNAAIGIGIFKYFNNKLESVWRRFDEHKERTESTYVRKDSCQLLHKTTADNLIGLETRLEKRFDKLEEQMIELLNNQKGG